MSGNTKSSVISRGRSLAKRAMACCPVWAWMTRTLWLAISVLRSCAMEPSSSISKTVPDVTAWV